MGRPYWEGRRAQETGRGSFRNPYEQGEYRRSHDPYFGDERMDDYDRRRAERDWDDGHRAARLEEERLEEEARRAEDRREQERRAQEGQARWEQEQWEQQQEEEEEPTE